MSYNPISASDLTAGDAAIKELAPAKINLFLHVGTRRADGFHPLQSMAVFTDFGDVLVMERADPLTLAVDGPFGRELIGKDDNLVLLAAKALLEKTSEERHGAGLLLVKNLPVASGIGGGSADAAAALRGLCRLWAIDPGEAGLQEIAAMLGSDVPVCVDSAPAFMEGRGEILRRVQSLPRIAILLVNPGISVSTRAVFAALDKRSGVDMDLPSGRFNDTADLLRFLETTCNDLEMPARALQPVIGEVLEAISALPGALFTRMSGSGATCFGLFADEDCCHRGAEVLRKTAPNWWVAPGIVPETGLDHEISGQDFGPSDSGL